MNESSMDIKTHRDYARLQAWIEDHIHGSPRECGREECDLCSVIDCPHNEPLHYHHDGCPSCDSSPADGEIERLRAKNENLRKQIWWWRRAAEEFDGAILQTVRAKIMVTLLDEGYVLGKVWHARENLECCACGETVGVHAAMALVEDKIQMKAEISPASNQPEIPDSSPDSEEGGDAKR